MTNSYSVNNKTSPFPNTHIYHSLLDSVQPNAAVVILLQLPAMYNFPFVAQQATLQAEKAENLWRNADLLNRSLSRDLGQEFYCVFAGKRFSRGQLKIENTRDIHCFADQRGLNLPGRDSFKLTSLLLESMGNHTSKTQKSLVKLSSLCILVY